MPTAWMINTKPDAPNIALRMNVTAIIETAMALYLGAIAPVFRQSEMIGPKVLLFSSQACNLGDDFEKQNAAKMIKGVVGRTGKNAPMAPNTSDVIPAINHQPLLRLLIKFPKYLSISANSSTRSFV